MSSKGAAAKREAARLRLARWRASERGRERTAAYAAKAKAKRLEMKARKLAALRAAGLA